MKKFNIHSLTFRLCITIIVFAIIPTSIMSFFIFTQAKDNLLEEQEKSINSELSLVSDNINSIFDNMSDNISYFSNSALLKSADKSITSYVNNTSNIVMTPQSNGGIESELFNNFEAFGKTHPLYQYIFMGTEDGGFVMYPDGNMDGKFDPRERPWYPSAKEANGDVVIGSPYYYESDNISIVGISQAVKNNNGDIIGVVGIDTSLEKVTTLFKNISDKSNGYYMLVDDSGSIIADPSNNKNNFKDLSEVYGKEFATAVNQNVSFKQIDVNGNSSYVTSLSSEKSGWNYVAVISEAKLLGNLNSMAKICAIVLIIILITSIIIALLISLKIIKPLKKLTTITTNLANGNLDAEIDINSNDEVGQLAISMKALVDRLQVYIHYIDEVSYLLLEIGKGNLDLEFKQKYDGDFVVIKDALLNTSSMLNNTLSQINVAAEQVASSSSQVSDSAQLLSEGASEQASSIEELSATINEISSNIKKTANKATTAKEISSESNISIMQSQNQMQQTINAMNEINNTSNEIGKIIKNIDDVAFQTNILALNAAVEAARAGSYGKGFAVVADEVRNLASKSAESAKNTAYLIDNALAAIEKGTLTVSETAKYLEKIVTNSQKSVDIIQSIADMSNEQALSIDQINIGVEQISAIVQTNSATSEESAAASEELFAQAQMLKDLINDFNLKDS
ncbi:methyl-accepting chemotaxis protein [Romboutsia sp.]|uniref:methyl-accepting chemotaxis protein n=1 Tax=Romboutsia sp. TaxID=1965302 RepID=UPI003F302F21